MLENFSNRRIKELKIKDSTQLGEKLLYKIA